MAGETGESGSRVGEGLEGGEGCHREMCRPIFVTVCLL